MPADSDLSASVLILLVVHVAGARPLPPSTRDYLNHPAFAVETVLVGRIAQEHCVRGKRTAAVASIGVATRLPGKNLPQPSRIFVVGASAGGVEALKLLATRLRAGFPGTVLIVLHIPPQVPSLLA